jgi:hypothetical protein
MGNTDPDRGKEIRKRADECPFWQWENTNVYGIGEGHCTAPGGASVIDGPDPCCEAGFRDSMPECKGSDRSSLGD